MLTVASGRPIRGRRLEARSGELLAADRGDRGIRTRRGDREWPVDRKDDPELRSGDRARRAAGLEVGADLGLHEVAVRVLEMDVEVVAPVRLIPVDVDRDGDPDHQ